MNVKKEKGRIKINLSVPLKMKRGQIVPQWSNTSSNPEKLLCDCGAPYLLWPFWILNIERSCFCMLCSGPQKNQQELIYLVICHSVHNYSSISLLLVHDIFRYGWLWLQGWPNQKRWENLWDADRIKMKYNFLFFYLL